MGRPPLDNVVFVEADVNSAIVARDTLVVCLHGCKEMNELAVAMAGVCDIIHFSCVCVCVCVFFPISFYFPNSFFSFPFIFFT